MSAEDDAERAIGKEDRGRLRARHPIHELAPCGRAGLERHLWQTRENLTDDRARMLVDSIVGAMELRQDHLIDMPLAELVREADEPLKWTLLFHLAGAGYRPAQLEVAARCAAEVGIMMALHDSFLGRTLDDEDRRLVARALSDAEAMVGHAVGWGALAHGMASEGRSGTVRSPGEPKAIGIEVTAALWAGVDTSARELGYREGYEEGSSFAEAIARRVDAALDDEERSFFAWNDVKEKWGLLRMTHNGSDRIDDIVDWAEAASERICDHCGLSGRLRKSGLWRVRCDACAGI